VLDNVRSAHNVGSVFRTADAFAVEAVYCCGITAIPPNRELLKTALGTADSLQWKYYSTTHEALMALKTQGVHITGVEQTDESIVLEKFKPAFNKRQAFVFGNEVTGLDDAILHLLDDCIEIPQFGTKHSFNISVTAGIVLWDYYFKKVI
jgi:tRNA G18 (ribose-2'-O)-methylase SpoU